MFLMKWWQLMAVKKCHAYQSAEKHMPRIGGIIT